MADRTDMDLAQMVRTLRALDKKVRTKIMRSANRKGLKVAVDLARGTAQRNFHGTGFMASQITQASGRGGPYKIVNRMGVKGGARKPDVASFGERFFGTAKTQKKGDAYYWRFLEFGTSKMPARPFLRVGFEGSRWLLFSIVKQEIRRGIELEARKLRKV